MKFGIVGAAGYWGPNWVRVLSQIGLLGSCCALDKNALEQVAERFSLSKKGVAVRKFKEALDSVGKLRTLLTVRANFGKYQKIGTIKDLLPHDLSIFRFLCQGEFTDIASYCNPNQDTRSFPLG